MYVYKRTEPNLWTVGFYTPEGKWEPDSDHDSPDKAAERVRWLNGSDATLRRQVDELRRVLGDLLVEVGGAAPHMNLPSCEQAEKLVTAIQQARAALAREEVTE